MNIEILLQDIYDIDASLKEHDAELRTILADMMEAKPDIKLDENFVRTLRLQLGERAQAQTEKGTSKGWLRNLIFGISGAAVMAVLFLTLTRLPMSQPAVFENKITAVGPNAFDLSGVTSSATAQGEAPTGVKKEAFAARTEVMPINNVGGSNQNKDMVAAPSVLSQEAVSDAALGAPTLEAPAKGSLETVVETGEGVVAPAPAKMIALPPYPDYEAVRYKFVYDGELPAVTDKQMAVFRRLPAGVSDKVFVNALKNFDLGLLDVGRFSNLKAEYMSFAEDKEYGYSIQISFNDGTININQNWSKWPNPYNSCTEADCYERLALKPSDIPSDGALIAIADKFMKDFGIELKNYGPAQVLNNQMPLYRTGDLAISSMPVYTPEYVSLVYPEKIEGKSMTETDGSPAGLMVSISVRDKKVSAVNNLRASDFEKSMYDTQTDTTSLLTWASKGGANYWEYNDPASKEVEVKLGAPEIIYYRSYAWSQKENRNDELLIPAYSFPIEASKDYTLYRKFILVPLIKGLEEQNISGAPVPMPLITK